MEHIFSSIINYYNRQELPNLQSYLQSKLSELVNSGEHIMPVLERLVLPDHTLAYLYILMARLETLAKQPPTAWGNWLELSYNFLEAFDPTQAALDKKVFYSFIKNYTNFAYNFGKVYSDLPHRVLRGVARAVEILKEPGEITPAHMEIAKLSLITWNYAPTVPLIESSYTHVNKLDTGITARDCVLFFYYAGCVSLALKRYGDAFEMFEQAIQVPCISIHAAALEALKKRVLVSLIVFGKNEPLPRNAPTVIQRIYKIKINDYINLAKVYSDSLISQAPLEVLDKQISTSLRMFNEDGNLGIIKKLHKTYIQQRIKRLTNTYITLPFAEIANSVSVSPSQAERIILEMIESGQINAKIDQERGMVSFSEETDYISSSLLNESCERVLELSKLIEDRSKDRMLDPDYIKRKLPLAKAFGEGEGFRV